MATNRKSRNLHNYSHVPVTIVKGRSDLYPMHATVLVKGDRFPADKAKPAEVISTSLGVLGETCAYQHEGSIFFVDKKGESSNPSESLVEVIEKPFVPWKAGEIPDGLFFSKKPVHGQKQRFWFKATCFLETKNGEASEFYLVIRSDYIRMDALLKDWECRECLCGEIMPCGKRQG